MSDEIVYGVNPVKEALRGSRRAFELFCAGELRERRLESVMKLAAEHGVPVRQRERRDLDRLCGTPHHQGVALRVESYRYADIDAIFARWKDRGEAGLVVILDSIQDPHNLGALIRTAACAGAAGVIIPKDRAVGVTATVEKASAGAVETISVAQTTNLVHAIDRCKQEGFWVYGLAGESDVSLFEQNLAGNVALVVGGEGEGLRPLVRKSCDVVAAIPLLGGVGSLNASVAGGIALFEVVRQRLQGKGKPDVTPL